MKKFKCVSIAVSIVFSLFFALSVQAEPSKEAAKAMVLEGVEYVKAHGAEKAFDAFNDPKGPFVRDGLYLFGADFNGIVQFFGVRPQFKGKNHFKLKDPDGNYFIQDMINLAKEKNQGWTEYKWSHPVTKKLTPKLTFVHKAPGRDVFIGCGVYKK